MRTPQVSSGMENVVTGSSRNAHGAGQSGVAHVAMLGMFPPPTTGAAKNNLILYETLLARGVETTQIRTSVSGLAHKRNLAYHVRRALRNGWVTLKLLVEGRRAGIFYMVPDAGLGSYYSLIHMIVATGLFSSVLIHHRSFRYIDSPSRAARLMTTWARARVTHVFLSPEMAARFQEQYGPVAFMIATNAHFVADQIAEPSIRSPGPIRIGHLSNLCRDKGFFLVAAVFEGLVERGLDVELWLAGPVIEPDVDETIKQLSRTHGDRVHYVGPLSGASKVAFYRNLDVFLFPTQHTQEAQPNVIYEALAAGIPVYATSRGCISEMLSGSCDSAATSNENYLSLTMSAISKLDLSDEIVVARKRAIIEFLEVECAESKKQYEALLISLGAD